MWRIEADPVLRTPIVVVGLLDRAPKPKRLRAALERASRQIVGLQHRIVPPPAGVGRPRWERDERFCLDHHLRWVGAVGGGVRGVLDLAEPDAAAPFDPLRPMWSLTVVEGLDGGRAAFVLRFHHAITDGIGGLELAGSLFDRTRRPAEPEVADGEVEGAGIGTPMTSESPSLGDRVADRVDNVLGAAGAALAAARHPTATIAGSLLLARSVRRLVAAPPPGSPLLVGRGLDRRLHVFERPLADLRRAASVSGGTINDALLAAVGGGFRTYHRQHQVTVPTMNVTMPVNRRSDGERPGGNRFTPVRFVLPVDDADPATRLKIAGAIARSWRAEPALPLTDVVARGLNLLPGPAVTRVFGSLLRTIDADIVDVAGLGDPSYLGGARIDRMWAFAPPTGAAFSVTLLSHQDTGCVAVSCDRTAIAQPELLMGALESSFDEILALGPESHVEEVQR
jgi:WS/DGAT/MGAT family acyltransferase